MPLKKTQVLLLLIIIARPLFSQGNEQSIGSGSQEIKKKPILAILNKFSLGFSSGYGRTFYSNRLDGYDVVRNPANSDSGLYIFPLKNLAYNQPITGIQNWLNNPSPSSITLNESMDSLRMLFGDSTLLAFRGNSSNIPLSLKIQYNFNDRFRAGGGFTTEFYHLPILIPVNGADIIGKYIPDKKNTIFLRYYGIFSARVYKWMNWSYYVDVEIGKLNMGKAFNKSAMSKGIYYNIGTPMEYEFSEYLRAVIRPSFEYKSYNINTGSYSSVNHQFPSFYLNIGFSYRIPEIPRCPVKAQTPNGYDYPKNFTNKSCRIQQKHVHGDLALRGQPFYKHQNPEIGENYPNLVKYRFFNKRKMSAGY